MNKRIKTVLGIMIGMMAGMVVPGGTISSVRLIRGNQIFPEYWFWGSGTIDYDNFVNAKNEAEHQASTSTYSAGWEAKGMDPINISRTLSEYHWDVFWPAVPFYGAGVQRLNASYTIDLRGYTPNDGYRQSEFEIKWSYPGSPTYALSHTNYVPLALGQITQVRCIFCPGWYPNTLPNGYASWGFTWLDPEIILLKEEQEHQPTKPDATSDPKLTAGDPIFIQTGNVSLDETDLSIPAPHIPLSFARTYGSLNNRMGILGSRWTHSWDWEVSTSNTVFNGVINEWLVFRKGDINYFKELNTPTNSNESAHAIKEDLTWTAVTNSDGTWNIMLAGGIIASFGTNGIINRLADAWSNSVQITYSNRMPIALQHSNGKSLILEYENNLLSGIKTVNTNLAMRYYYSTNGLLTNAVTYADGKSYSTVYLWNEVGQVVTQRINAIGDIRCWEYDGQKGTRSWIGTNRWYDTSVSYSENGSGQCEVTEWGEITSLVYLWDFNAIFSKPDQINGPMSGVTSFASEDNGTNIITLVFYPNSTNELEACLSNTYFQTLNSTYGIMNAASRNQTHPITRNTYDDRGNQIMERVEEYSVDLNVIFSLTLMEYDILDRMTNFAFGFNGTPTNFYVIAWDENAQLLSRLTDPEGHVVSCVYTNGSIARESVQVASGVSNETIYVYSTNGLLIAVTNANHHALHITYDNSENPTSMIVPESPTIEMSWTSLGYLDEIRMPSDTYDTNGVMVLRTTKFNTDSRGSVNAVTWSDGLSDYYYRDSIGQVTNWVDRVGRRTQYAYLPTKKLASVTRYLGNQAVTTKMDYDKQFNVLKITDPLNRVVESYQLDDQSRPIKVSNVNSQDMEISYAMGDRVNTIKRFDGTTVSNAYTGDGWLGVVKYPDENVILGYYRNGLLKTASNPTGTVAFVYNGAGQVLSVSNAVLNGLVSYAVDGLGQATSTVWNGIGITKGYSSGEQLNYVKVPTGEVYRRFRVCEGILYGLGRDLSVPRAGRSAMVGA